MDYNWRSCKLKIIRSSLLCIIIAANTFKIFFANITNLINILKQLLQGLLPDLIDNMGLYLNINWTDALRFMWHKCLKVAGHHTQC